MGSWVHDLTERQEDMLGNSGEGRAHTAALRVSPSGNGKNGRSWKTAYQTLQAALDAASTNANDSTLILLGPKATAYDIYTIGDPTWSANVEIRGTYRNWASVFNSHGSATSVLKLSGKAALQHLTIDCGAGSNNGLILTGDGPRLNLVYIEAEDVTGAQTAVELSGGIEYAIIQGLTVHGVQAYTKALLMDDCSLSVIERMAIHHCLTGLQLDTNSDDNVFSQAFFHFCTLAIDIDSGDYQFFNQPAFAACTTNVDDEVKNHGWGNPQGAFHIYISPDNLTGIAVTCGAAGVYGGDTELIAAAAIDAPFRIVGAHFESNEVPEEFHQVRFSDDSGSSWYDIMQFKAAKREGIAAPSGTEHIFNAGTRISCSARNETGAGTVQVWLEVQPI